MSRLAAAVVAALLSVSGPAALRHVHVYGGHDHGEHWHGPAAHGHAPGHRHHADVPVPSTTLERCDAGDHAVSVVFTYVAPHLDHVPAPVTLAATLVVPPEQVWRHVAPSEVRAHSPPRLTDAPLRAPPVVHPA